jgi:hypothetical protein
LDISSPTYSQTTETRLVLVPYRTRCKSVLNLELIPTGLSREPYSAYFELYERRNVARQRADRLYEIRQTNSKPILVT